MSLTPVWRGLGFLKLKELERQAGVIRDLMSRPSSTETASSAGFLSAPTVSNPGNTNGTLIVFQTTHTKPTHFCPFMLLFMMYKMWAEFDSSERGIYDVFHGHSKGWAGQVVHTGIPALRGKWGTRSKTDPWQAQTEKGVKIDIEGGKLPASPSPPDLRKRPGMAAFFFPHSRTWLLAEMVQAVFEAKPEHVYLKL